MAVFKGGGASELKPPLWSTKKIFFQALSVERANIKFFRTKEENFEKDLISLINAYPSQNREFINNLLKLFRKHKLVDLPIDIRTLMQTPKQLNLRSVSPGVYFHFGLETAISHHLPFYENYNTIDHIFFDFNIH